jgi:hypothetical protein
LTGDGRTPLYFASLEGSAESVKLLLEHGANAHIRTAEEKGKDAKEVALLFGNAEVAAMLDEALALPAPEPRPLKAGARDVEGKASKRGGKAAGGKGGKEEAGDAVDGEEAIRAKAEEYAARKPVEWKKSDFSKWGQMSDTDWEGLEAEYDLKATTATTTSKSKKNPPLASGHFAADDGQEASKQRGEGKAPARQGYGSSKIGPPSGPQVTADHPRYGVLQEYKRIKAKWEEQKTNVSHFLLRPLHFFHTGASSGHQENVALGLVPTTNLHQPSPLPPARAKSRRTTMSSCHSSPHPRVARNQTR